METRVKKSKQVISPDRTKVWTERSPKLYQQKIIKKKVAVVYYLSRNCQLEHPHFMEVPLSSPNGLFLRDVIERLNVLRGRGMASLYSWSSKRSYKNGYVWHDLCEDDLIPPAHGNEYVLKGSELFDESNSGHSSPVVNTNTKNSKQLPERASCRSRDVSSSSSSMNEKGTKCSQEDEVSPPAQRLSSSVMSPESRSEKNSSSGGSLSLTEYKVYKNEGLADASTQTEETVSTPKPQVTITRGVSTDERLIEPEYINGQDLVLCLKENSDICTDSVSPHEASPSASSSGAKTETLESLIRADASKINSFRILEEKEIRLPTNARLKATNMLMQLISCGSISVKDHSFGLVPSYRTKFANSKFPSSFFSNSFMLGDLDRYSENPRLMSLRLEDKEYFSGSLVETKLLNDGAHPSLKRSSSYNADRSYKQSDMIGKKDDSSVESKSSITKKSESESTRSPLCLKARNSSDRLSGGEPKDGGKRVTVTKPDSVMVQSKRLDSFREENEVIKTEESLLQELES